MWSDDVKAEAIARCSDNKDFIMEDGDLSTVRFPDDPEFPVPTLSRLEAMCDCLLYTSPSPRDRQKSRMPSSA